MSAPVVALDADVLVPIIACDFLLTAFDLRLYEPVVSAKALDEVQRNLIKDFPHLDRTAIGGTSAVIDALVAKRTNPPTTRAAMLAALRRIIPSAIDYLSET